MLSKRSHSLKVTCYIVALYDIFEEKIKAIGMGNQSVVSRSWDSEDNMTTKEIAPGIFGGMKLFCILFWWWLHESIHVLKFIELYTKNNLFHSVFTLKNRIKSKENKQPIALSIKMGFSKIYSSFIVFFLLYY